MLRIIGLLSVFFALTACSLFQSSPQENQKAMCKELKHRMIFNGATPNQTIATTQRAEMGNLTQSYRNQGCE